MNTHSPIRRSARCAQAGRSRFQCPRWLPWLAAYLIAPTGAVGNPANDDFAAAAGITGASGFASGSNVEATAEPGEPDHAGWAGGASVWWRWTAPSSGRAVFSTIGSHFDTVMAVYVGQTMGELTLIAENDDELPADPDSIVIGGVYGYQSRVEFEAEAGATYRVAVDGLDFDGTATGDVVLSWVLGLPNDDFADAAEINGSRGIALGTTKGATSEPGEPVLWGFPSTGASVWWRWTAPSSGAMTFGLVRSDDEDFDTVLTVWEGMALDDLVLEAANDASVGVLLNLESTVTFEASEGKTYWVAADGVFDETPDVVLRWTRDPENDAFAEGFEIGGPSGTTTGDIIFATVDPWSNEPDHGGEPGGASVWWKWTPTADGPVTFDTFGSTFDTVLAVYVGDEVWEDGFPFPTLDLALIDSNDDAGGGSQSSITLEAVAGTDYRIAVANFDYRERGDIVLNWRSAGGSLEPLRIEDVSQLPGGAFHFVLRGPKDAEGTIYRSTGFDEWEPWRPFTLDAGRLEVTDSDTGSSKVRFYRAASP